MPTTRSTLVGGGALAAAIALIAPFIMHEEGRSTKVYHDVGGVLTTCYGHTGNDLNPNHTYTEAECQAFLVKDMTTVGTGILKTSPQLAQPEHKNQLAAVISFSYNVGVGNYNTGVAPYFNKGDYSTGCAAMLKYDYAGGKYYQGLANRRQQEYVVCMTPVKKG